MNLLRGKSQRYFIAGLILAGIMACNKQKKNDEITCAPCLASALIRPGITVKIVDKATGNDLFFGSTAPYTLSQLKMYQVLNGKSDSIFLFADTIAHNIFVGLTPLHNTDTVTMQIANLSQDNLIINTYVAGPCCPSLVVGSVFFDGVSVYTALNGPAPVILKK